MIQARSLGTIDDKSNKRLACEYAACDDWLMSNLERKPPSANNEKRAHRVSMVFYTYEGGESMSLFMRQANYRSIGEFDKRSHCLLLIRTQIECLCLGSPESLKLLENLN